MKNKLMILALLLSIGGCASFEEAYIYDREFGQATKASFASQIVHPDKQTKKVPEGLAGITAEELMKVYNGTFAEKPQQINVMSLGGN